MVLSAALLRAGWQVSLYSDRTAEDHLADRGRPTACLFGDQVEYEAELGLPTWSQASPFTRIHLDLYTPAGPVAFSVDAPLDKPALAVDQRLKFSSGLAELAARGAEVVIGAVSLEDLDDLAASHDLVVVTVGHKAFQGLFPRDDARSTHTEPQRKLFMVNVAGYDLDAHPVHRQGVFSFLPGTVEVFWIPFWDKDVGESRSIVVEITPGGKADRFDDVTTADEGLAVFKEVVAELLPGELPFVAPTRATSPVTFIKGAIVPVVRHPVAELPSGRHVLGLGDAVVLNDPLSGQGANNATRMAKFFAERLTAHDGAITAPWLREQFDAFWEKGRYATEFTNGLLAPLRDHQKNVLLAASHDEEIGARLWSGFNDPSSLFPWFFDETEAHRYLAERQVGRGTLLRYKLGVAARVIGGRLSRRS
ncbi:FAD-dependent oxidoreductase [Saccharothrix violaceirubra]|uniref:Styrene monooxygenase StyA putative substrate binding domain-containing protein n=1 Tax=Saccharothrix violaceirubra TaxID=413306 RepID=A0A7W7T7S3_9PSEU|nr:styrene monooxygenase/indole monooxygenase family protein [Saccharothrix violaceirubra]MBB4968106.1 hypothetical protein [Saccharothrix violaceirubra]